MSSEAKIAKELERKETEARIKELERNIADLKKLQALKDKNAKASKPVKTNKTKGKVYTQPMAPVVPAQPASTQNDAGDVLTQAAGGLVGAGESLLATADGLVRVAGNTVLQIGDILTFGLNHDSDIIQQAWIEQGALAAGAIRVVTEPGEVIGGMVDSIEARAAEAERLRAAGEEFEAARVNGKLGGDFAQAVLGAASALRAAGKIGVAILNEPGPRPGSPQAQRGSIGVPKESGASILRKTRAERLEELAKDPSHNGKIDAKSRREAEVGMELEDSGQLKGPITRDPTGAAEFIDANGQKWDIKAFNSAFAPKGYNLDSAMAKIQGEISKGELVIIDTQNMTAAHVSELSKAVEEAGLGGKVIFH